MTMCDHAIVRPPAVAALTPRSCEQAFPGHREQVREGRALLAAFLADCPAAEDAVLLVSELAANACAHTASGQPGGTFTVRAEICPGAYIHAEVEDQGSGWDGDIAVAESPHGLYLLRELSDDFGTRPGKRGWITWFTIASSRQATPS
jgi:anti-sigma regulatory factor (Ser/Thr protein kinase)